MIVFLICWAGPLQRPSAEGKNIMNADNRLRHALPGNAAPGPARRRIYLMRHAEVCYFDAAGKPLDPRHVPLTPTGRSQAVAAAGMLAGVAFDLALCSGLARTLETARLVLGGRDLPVHEEGRFKEVKAGRLAAVSAEAREQAIAYAYDHAEAADAAFIGGERWVDFRQRVLAAWDALVAQEDWRNALVVAHDAVNRVLLAHVAGAGLASLKAFEQDPACVNVVELDVVAGRVQRAFLRAVNLAPYDLLRLDGQLMVMEKVFRAYAPD